MESPQPMLDAAGDVAWNRYRLLIELISIDRGRLLWLDTIFLFANLFAHGVVLYILGAHPEPFALTGLMPAGILPVSMALMFLAVGMALNACWITQALRSQMKLKLRYFQLRAIERTLDPACSLIVDEDRFFGGEVIESTDGKERTAYPTTLEGAMSRSKQRIFSWFLPLIFFASYAYGFVYVIARL